MVGAVALVSGVLLAVGLTWVHRWCHYVRCAKCGCSLGYVLMNETMARKLVCYQCSTIKLPWPLADIFR